MTLLDDARALAAACNYDEIGSEGGVDDLIAYKDALEGEHFALAARVDDLEANLREQLAKAEAALAAAVREADSWPVRRPGKEDHARQAHALQGAVDAWRIALGYFDGGADVPRSADAVALDDLNDLFSSPSWDGAAGMLEDACEIIRRVRVENPDPPERCQH